MGTKDEALCLHNNKKQESQANQRRTLSKIVKHTCTVLPADVQTERPLRRKPQGLVAEIIM
jgi:hypothetical protein